MHINLDCAEIFFGDCGDKILIKGVDENLPLTLKHLKEKIHAKCIVFLNQTHGINSLIIDEKTNFEEDSFRQIEGDIVITNQKNIGIGVLTADCLPVVIIDSKRFVIAAVHAGWQGTVLGACQEAIKKMQNRFGSQLYDLEFYFGPAAKSCCYEIQSDFLLKNEDVNLKYFLINRAGKIFFNFIDFNKQKLYELGIVANQIKDQSCFCTICGENYCSYRRSKNFYRQATIVALK